MKENNKMILIISIVAIIILAIIGYFIFDNYYNADERAAQKARERAFEAERTYQHVKSNYEQTKRDIDNYKKERDRINRAKWIKNTN